MVISHTYMISLAWSMKQSLILATEYTLIIYLARYLLELINIWGKFRIDSTNIFCKNKEISINY